MEQKRLKIAFLCRDLGKVNRGVETYVQELSSRLEDNHEVTVFTGHDADSFGKIAQGGFDVVIPTNGRMQALKASIGRMIGGYKTIVSGQAGPGRDDIWNIAITAPDVFIALTELEKQWAKNIAWKSKIVKIPNGVDLEKFNPQGKNVSLDLPRPIILSVGALTWYKHHERTIKALKEMDEGSLLIMGTGPEEKDLQKLIESLNLSSRVKIMQVDFAQIPDYYRSADLFVLPSWDREAFGIVYVEALASGLAVVAPDDLGRREIVGEVGILVNVDNPKAYAQAMKDALSRDWKDLPRKQAEKFSWNKVAKEYENLFTEMFV